MIQIHGKNNSGAIERASREGSQVAFVPTERQRELICKLAEVERIGISAAIRAMLEHGAKEIERHLASSK